MTKNRTPTPVYLDPGMHSGLEVKGLKIERNHLNEPQMSTSVWSSLIIYFIEFYHLDVLNIQLLSTKTFRSAYNIIFS